MGVDTVTTFFALLAVFGLVVVLSVGVIAVVSAIRGGVPTALRPMRAGLGEVSLWLAFFVALTCTLGSLYLSEVAKFPPCELCWYQRILMYPQVIILGVAALRRDASVRWYTLPMVGLGLCISVYHYLVERFPDSVSYSCSSDIPCSTVWVWKFHFLSIPAMAGIGFALIAVLTLLASPAAATHTSQDSQDSIDPRGTGTVASSDSSSDAEPELETTA